MRSGPYVILADEMGLGACGVAIGVCVQRGLRVQWSLRFFKGMGLHRCEVVMGVWKSLQHSALLRG